MTHSGLDIYPTTIDGVFDIYCFEFTDNRGAFLNALPLGDKDFAAIWGARKIRQVNISRTEEISTVRGIHYQRKPYMEAKLIRCIKGRVWDVIVDLRPGSSTYCKWHATELSTSSLNAIFVPEGCAHGFQVLDPNSEILYLHSGMWVASAETGVRFDDPQLAIPWPMPPQGLSQRDLELPLLELCQ